MGFLAPLMLWGTAAAAIPIALHLFFRSRYRTIPWAAMRFLLTSIEQTSRRLLFQELLLLVVRCAVVVLLAIALARPLSTVVRGAGQGDAVDAVLLFDTSMSMGASDGAVDRLQRAKQAALKIVDELPSYSTVQIVACADRAWSLGPQAPADLEQARTLIQSVALTSLATDLYPGVSEAAGVLQRGQSANKEFYLFSDMQKSGWKQQTGDLVRSLREIKDKAAVFLVRCGTRTPANVAVVGITPQSGVARPGARSGFAVLVRDSGTEPVKNLTVSLVADGNDKLAETQALPLLNPGETRAVTLTAKLEKAGLRVLTAKVDHDDLAGDNRFDQAILVRDRINVLVVDGGARDRDPEKWSSFNLLNALQPVNDTLRAQYHVQPRLVTPRLAAPALLANADLCILVNVALQPNAQRAAEVPPSDFLDGLARFVKEGKGLIVYAGDNVAADAYNRVLGKKHGLLPLPLKGFMEQAGRAALHFNPNSAGMPAFWRFRDDAYYKGFKDIEIYKAVELEEPARKDGTAAAANESVKRDPLTVVFRYANGKPAVVASAIGSGEVFFITTSADKGWQRTSADPAWTDWPLRFEFVPFVDVMVNHLLEGQMQAYNIRAGEKFDWHPSSKAQRAYTLLRPDGTQSRLGLPENRDGRLVVSAPALPHAGIYHMIAMLPPQARVDHSAAETLPDKAAGMPIAVIPDLRETQDLTALTDEEIDQRLGFRPIHVTAGAAATFGADERFNREWTPWLLLAVLVLAVAEALLAYWCGRAW